MQLQQLNVFKHFMSKFLRAVNKTQKWEWRGCNRPEREGPEGDQREKSLHSSIFWGFRGSFKAYLVYSFAFPPALSACFHTYIFPFCFFSRYVLLLFILFFIPGVMMIIAYGLISRELYRGMQFELGQNTESAGEIQQKFKPNSKNFLICTDLEGIHVLCF